MSAPQPTSLDDLTPTLQHASRECFAAAERDERRAESCRQSAKAVEAAGQVEHAVEWLRAAQSYSFSARALHRAGSLCAAVLDDEDEVRALIVKRRAARAKKAGGQRGAA